MAAVAAAEMTAQNETVNTNQCTSPEDEPKIDKVTALRLAVAGWRTFVSKTHCRKYFYNRKLARHSWAVPVVENVKLPAPFDNDEPYIEWEDESFCNVDIYPTDVYLRQPQQPYNRFHPHLDVEVRRNDFFSELSKSIEKVEGIKVPEDILRKALFIQKQYDRGQDPVFSTTSTTPCRTLVNEVRQVLGPFVPDPEYESKTGVTQETRMAKMYHNIIRGILQSGRGVPYDLENENREELQVLADEAAKYFGRYSRAFSSEPNDKSTWKAQVLDLNNRCEGYLQHVSKRISDGILGIFREKGEMLVNMNTFILKVQGLTECTDNDPNAPGVDKFKPDGRGIVCRPARLIQPKLTMSDVSTVTEIARDGRRRMLLTYGRYCQELNYVVERKLRYMYERSCKEDFFKDEYLERLFVMLKRYSDFSLPSKYEWSLHPSIFRCLNGEFGVTFECFASPLNCFFRQFCSAFPDTDGYFGSRGSFFDYQPVSGSFVVNPPLNEELLVRMAAHIEDLLLKSDSKDGLSFVIFLPWPATRYPIFKRLTDSKFRRSVVNIPIAKGRQGEQHFCSTNDVETNHENLTVLFLQTKAGCKKWAPTTKKVGLLKEACARSVYEGKCSDDEREFIEKKDSLEKKLP